MKAVVAALAMSVAAISVTSLSAQEKSTAPAAGPLRVGSNATMTPPEGWSVEQQRGLVRFIPPERDLRVTIVPIAAAKDGSDAAAQAWKLASESFARPVRISQSVPARDGWEETVVVNYDVPPSEKAIAQAVAFRRGSAWTVVTIEGAIATIAKRGGQFNASADTLRPVGFAKETFAGKTARRFDPARVEELKRFVQASMAKLKIPGVGLAIIDHGAIVYEGGVGVRDVAAGTRVDKDTRFMIASNTKGMTTLLLAMLVDEGKLNWNKPVVDYLPSFRLGSADTTRKVLVKHLVCACTGLPRKDMQWLFNTRKNTGPAETFAQLAATQPTSGFGEVYQYNNLMASAAGYLAGHILYPDIELGAAYDKAMRERIFVPLGMARTTLSNVTAMTGNWAKPYDTDIYDKLSLVDARYNETIVPYRPAGGAWSTAHDMALYVRDELDGGVLPNGRRLVSAVNLLARRTHNVPTGENVWYGMGLEDDASMGVSVIQHGGSLFGYKSNWFAIPSAQIGVVVLTNSENGYSLAEAVKRRMLELLYDGKPEAEENIASIAKRSDEALVKFRSELDLPTMPERSRPLLGTYFNQELGALVISFDRGKLMLRATSIWSQATTKRNKDGTTSLVTISPGIGGLNFLVATRNGQQTLVLNDAQHEYVFTRNVLRSPGG